MTYFILKYRDLQWSEEHIALVQALCVETAVKKLLAQVSNIHITSAVEAHYDIIIEGGYLDSASGGEGGKG